MKVETYKLRFISHDSICDVIQEIIVFVRKKRNYDRLNETAHFDVRHIRLIFLFYWICGRKCDTFSENEQN